MLSTAATIYDGTGPSTKNPIYTKAGGAGKAYFQDVGNVLYWGDGVNQKKWLPALSSFAAVSKLLNRLPTPPIISNPQVFGDMFIDGNGNIQVCITPGMTQPALHSFPSMRLRLVPRLMEAWYGATMGRW